MASAGTAYVDVLADTAPLKRQLKGLLKNRKETIRVEVVGGKQAQTALRTTARETTRLGKSQAGATREAGRHGKALRTIGYGAAYALGAGGFGGGMYALFDITKKSISAFHESQQASRQTAAAIKSTGGAANVTTKQVAALANALASKTGIDDEAIQASENLLLTFTSVRNEAGKGNKIFDGSTKAILDMATAMNHGATPSTSDLHSATLQLGKALQDPVKGMGALRRVGVAFDAQQQKTIKGLVASGHTMEAQKMILKELGKEFGGSAAKQATAGKKLQVTLGNVAEMIGQKLNPYVQKGAKGLEHLLKIMTNPKLSGAQKWDQISVIFQRLGDKALQGFQKAMPKIADAAAAAAPKVVKAFFNGWNNSSLWGKAAVAIFAGMKLGAFSRYGLRAGAGMGAGMAEGVAKSPGAKTGFLGKLGPFAKRAGYLALGLAAIDGLTTAFEDTGRQKKLGDKMGDFVTGASRFLGVSGGKTVDETFSKASQSLSRGLISGKSVMVDDRGKTDEQVSRLVAKAQKVAGKHKILLLSKLDDKHFKPEEHKLHMRLVRIQRNATLLFGHPVKLKVNIDPAQADRAMKRLRIGTNLLKNQLGVSLKDISKLSNRNLADMAVGMNLHSREGRKAVEKNMRLTARAITSNLKAGQISGGQALRALDKSFRVHMKASKESATKNMPLVVTAIRRAMKSGQVSTRDGLAEISRLFRFYLGQYGIKGRDAEVYLNHIKGGKYYGDVEGGHAKGRIVVKKAAKGLIQFGKPGEKGPDNIPVNFGGKPIAVGSGEVGAVLNRQQQAELNARTIDVGGLQGFFKTYNRPHTMAKGGFIPRQIVKGGADGQIKPGVQAGLDAVVAVANKLLKRAKDEGGSISGTPKHIIDKVVLPIARSVGINVTAASVAAANAAHGPTNSGGRSDHQGPPGQAWAADMSDGVTTPAEDKLASKLAKRFGIPWSGAGAASHAIKGYAEQMIYRSYVGGNHFNHVHFGIHRAAKGLLMKMAGGGVIPNWATKAYPRVGLGGPSIGERKTRMLAEWAKFSPGRALQMAQIAHGESGYSPGADGGIAGTSGPAGYGLWQITPGAWGGSGTEDIYKKFHSLGSRSGMFHPIRNAKMARFMYGQSGLHPWYGTKYLQPLKSGVKSVFGAGGAGSASDSSPAAAKAKPLTKKQRRHLKRLTKSIKGLGLSKGIEAKMKKLTGNVDLFSEFAERAGTLGGKVHGFDELHWLQYELQTLFELRNTIIKAHARAVKLRERATRLIKRATKELVKLRKHPKANATMIGRLKRSIIPGFKKARTGLKARDGELLSSLTDIQGLGSSMKVLSKLPAVGALGGSIFTVQSRLKELGTTATATDGAGTENTAAADRASERADMLQQLLTESRLRTKVSEKELSVLKVPFGGSFAEGGVVPGPIGAPRIIQAHGGEEVLTADQRVGSHVEVHVDPAMAFLKQFIRVEVRDDNRRTSRGAARALPGGAR